MGNVTAPMKAICARAGLAGLAHSAMNVRVSHQSLILCKIILSLCGLFSQSQQNYPAVCK